MANNFNLTDLVLRNLPTKKKKSSQGGFYFNCVMCTKMGESRNDTKMRCGFTPQNQGFLVHCHNCQFATGWSVNGRVTKKLMSFLNQIGIDSKEIPIALRLLSNSETLKNVNYKTNEIVDDFEEIKLPIGAKSIKTHLKENENSELFLKGLTYLRSRGDAIRDGWEYYWTKERQFGWNQRIIIPFINDGIIVGYTGRRFNDNDKLSKYFSKQPKEYMFNQDKLLDDKENIVFIVEGIFDAIAIDGVAILGNSLSEKQRNLLKRTKKRIILIPDRDIAGKRLLDDCLSLGIEISIPENWINDRINDCAEATIKYGKIYTIKNILDNIYTESSTIMIKFEIWKI